MTGRLLNSSVSNMAIREETSASTRPQECGRRQAQDSSLDTPSTHENSGTAVVEDYVDKIPFKFTGVLENVVIEPGKSGLAANDDKKFA
jgi:hypothetical protein